MVKKSFKIRDNLAEALGDTVTSAKNNAGELYIEIVPLRKIELDPDNPRDLAVNFSDLYHGITTSDPQYQRKAQEKLALTSIAHSIKSQGIINPIVVYKFGEKYRLIAGERRILASIIAGKVDIPAKILTAKPEPFKLSLLQWIENIEREDLTLWERLRNLDKIFSAYAKHHEKSQSELTATELSQVLGCSIQQASHYLILMQASQSLRHAIQNGMIKNIEKAALIAKTDPALHDNLITACINGATLKQLKQFIQSQTRNVKPLNLPNKGRPAYKISLGFTKSTKVAQVIIDCVLNHDRYTSLRSKLGSIDWKDNRAINHSFKKLIQLLEQTEK